jgi:hypothetical protein
MLDVNGAAQPEKYCRKRGSVASLQMKSAQECSGRTTSGCVHAALTFVNKVLR